MQLMSTMILSSERGDSPWASELESFLLLLFRRCFLRRRRSVDVVSDGMVVAAEGVVSDGVIVVAAEVGLKSKGIAEDARGLDRTIKSSSFQCIEWFT